MMGLPAAGVFQAGAGVPQDRRHDGLRRRPEGFSITPDNLREPGRISALDLHCDSLSVFVESPSHASSTGKR